jgi:hypothetical protein
MKDTLEYHYDVIRLTELYNRNELPSRTIVELKTLEKNRIQVPIEQIAYAKCQKNDLNGKLTGLLIGGAIDLTLTIIIWSSIINSFE